MIGGGCEGRGRIGQRTADWSRGERDYECEALRRTARTQNELMVAILSESGFAFPFDRHVIVVVIQLTVQPNRTTGFRQRCFVLPVASPIGSVHFRRAVGKA